MTIRFTPPVLLALETWLLIVFCGQTFALPPRPNVVVILVDDMGFSDLGCYGGEIPTPNIDALAAGGLRYTRFYNAGRCSPSRASLLTGLYSQQTGIGRLVADQGLPGYRGGLNDQCVTLAEVLQQAGYATSMTGKWHIGRHDGTQPGPWMRGFDQSLNSARGGFYMASRKGAELFLDGNAIADTDPRLPQDWYATDLFTTFGLRFIDDARSRDRPFFLFLSHVAPHFPLQATADQIARFRGQYRKGWDQLRKTRHQKQIELGVVDAAWPLSERPSNIPAWDSLTDQQQDRFDHLMAVYAAVMVRMDQAVGNLVDGLRQRQVLDNTLILFISDNGGSGEPSARGATIGDPTQPNSRWLCGAGWAYAQCTPFYRYKRFTHEGGIATPLIVHWPGGVPDHGKLRRRPAHLIDIMPTLVEVCDATYPQILNGKPILPMEGKSLLPTFADQPIADRALYWEHMNNVAMRRNDFKLVREGPRGPWELYNMRVDATEQNNLAAEHPETLRAMIAQWDAWARRTQVLPSPNSSRKAKQASPPKAQLTRPADIASPANKKGNANENP